MAREAFLGGDTDAHVEDIARSAGVTGSTLLRALGGICETRATEGWLGEAQQITALLFDGLRYGAPRAT
ncbi:hypothetical protein [Streptosporangium amethystogenes]|uniref:hypothetical protein n=1 Tax=Streptosporangium amethystogenes TaxID=2002 RepID=UPI0004C8EC6A|nr:hypothetical protein [Streptosporangium amethystogenes]